MTAWKRSTRIDRTCCGGIFTGRFVSLLIKKISAGQKLIHLLANSFELSMINDKQLLFIIFSERESPQITGCRWRPAMKFWLSVLTF